MKSFKDMIQSESSELSEGLDRTMDWDSALQPYTRFAILTTLFGSNGITQYVSNEQREDIIKWMRETADRLEAREEVAHGSR